MAFNKLRRELRYGVYLEHVFLHSVTLRVTLATVIRSFKHKGIEKFYTAGSKAGIQPQHADRLRLILGRLNVSAATEDMNLPGLGLHRLKGDRRGAWAVKVSGNWRVTFEFVGKDTDHVDYEDYH
jgi:proteic killer suppression protein